MKLTEAKDKEAQALSHLLKDKRAEGRNLTQLIYKKKKYHDYLATSANFLHLGPNKFSDIFDVLNRYELLRQISDMTRQRLKTLDKEILAQRAEFDRLLIERENYILQRNNEVSLLCKKSESCKNEAASLQNLGQNTSTEDETRELGRLYFYITYTVERFQNQANAGKKEKKSRGETAARRRGPTSTGDDGDMDKEK